MSGVHRDQPMTRISQSEHVGPWITSVMGMGQELD